MKMHQAYYLGQPIGRNRRTKREAKQDIEEYMFYKQLAGCQNLFSIESRDVPKSKVIVQYPYAAVKENYIHGDKSYDVWTWNVYKLKWTRMSNHGCGFSELKYAAAAALEESKTTEDMLNNNRTAPTPCI